MEENPLLTMLADNISKWKRLVDAIDTHKQELKSGEDAAYEDLRDHWMFFDFDAQKCETLLNEMAKYKAKHAKNEFLENLQEFRHLAKSYYTKDKAVFEVFQKAMGGKRAKQQPKSGEAIPQPQQFMEENPLLTMLADNISKWKRLVDAIDAQKEKLKSGEDAAYRDLRDHWMSFDFDAQKCESLLDEMAKYKAKHAKDEFLENLQEFRHLAKSYYTKDKAVFEAFQQAMGGKGAKRQPKPEETIPQPKPKPQPNQNIISYDDGYYTGEQLNGKPHGKGMYVFNNGNWWDGNFVQGKLHGFGKQYYADAKRLDSGEYSHGMRVGKGKMQWESGDWYEGEWNDDGSHGQGQQYIAQYGRTDIGHFHNGKRKGRGRMQWDDGDWYEGEWNENGAHGQGQQYIAKYGRTDTGQFQNHNRKGRGRMQWDDGDWYEGEWDDSSGSLNGRGMYHYSNGRQTAGNWVNGKFVESNVYGEKRKKYESGGAILSKILQSMIYWPWIILVIVVIVKWITSGFWWAVLTAIIGGIIAYFMMFVTAMIGTILDSILQWFLNLSRKTKIILISILAVMVLGNPVLSLVSYLIFSFQSNDVPVAPVKPNIPDIKGVWQGTFGERGVATLEIINVSENNEIEAVIKLKSIEEHLKGVLILPADSIRFEEIAPNNGKLDGHYEAKFDVEKNLIEGTYTPVKANSKNKVARFSFTR
jgi:hypothetical protein